MSYDQPPPYTGPGAPAPGYPAASAPGYPAASAPGYPAASAPGYPPQGFPPQGYPTPGFPPGPEQGPYPNYNAAPPGSYPNQPGYQGYPMPPQPGYGGPVYGEAPKNTVYVVEQGRRDESGEQACLTACWTALCCCCLWDMLT
ncbi:cysteine-rich and transmembrane domain-containing protein 1 [Tachysurus ichikawai]